jgi:hypothetical protein
MPRGGNAGVSLLVVEEAFSAADDRFLDLFAQLADGKDATRIVDKWKRDFRPWARQQLHKFFGHSRYTGYERLVAKRFFKHAEEKGDDERVGFFMARFDRLSRRRERKRRRWDYATRSWGEETYLKTDPTVWFSAHTAHYLQRRAWRYFRRIGFKRPDDYPAAVAKALVHYRDADLEGGLAVLDSWGLIHACFGQSDALTFTRSRANLKHPAPLADMVAPYFPEAWKRPPSAPILLDLLWSAQSRVVRIWSAHLLRRDHQEALANAPLQNILKLLDHDDPEIQQLAAELLQNIRGLDKLDVATWLSILSTQNLTTLALLTTLFRKHVRPDRLSIDQAIDLATARPTPVARLGLDFLRQLNTTTDAARASLARLATARCQAVAKTIAAYALSLLGTPDHYHVDHVSPFFDSLLAPTRAAAWDWLTENSPGWNDPALWARLLETPYDDVRLKLVAALEARTKLPGLTTENLSALWTPVLLAVHRGGRTKLTALRQISHAIRDNPQSAEPLLPVLAVAIRSVRGPEARHGLAAIVAAVDARPDLEPLLKRYLPELVLEGAPA